MEISKKDDPNKKVKKAPNLVFLHGKSNAKNRMEEFQTCFNMRDKKCCIESVWQMQEFKCWPTAQGWIFMISPHFKCSLFNFFDKTSIQLPSLRYKGVLEDDWCECVLAKRNSNYVVMFVNYTHQCIYFFDDNNGGKKWIRYNYHDEEKEKNLRTVGSCNGHFYGASFTNILAIDYIPKPKITTLEPLKFSEQRAFNCMRLHMLDVQGGLYVVCRYYIIASSVKTAYIVVWKRNSSSSLWSKVEDIGNWVFFLGTGSLAAAWSATEMESKGNLIYYVEPRNKVLHCYDLGAGTITVDNPCPSVKSQFCYPTWIFPVL